jgi:hypothetical protein
VWTPHLQGQPWPREAKTIWPSTAWTNTLRAGAELAPEQPTALFYELWRVEAGPLVEVIAPNVPAEANLPHRNGYF